MLKSIFICIMLSFANLLIAQEKGKSKTPYLSIPDRNVEQVYNHLKFFLLDNDYFVQSMDSKQGFVQVKVLPATKGVFTKEVRNNINFFVVPDGDTSSKICLQINSEVLDWNGNVSNSSHYYKDKGVLKAKNKMYDDIISQLKKYYDLL